MQNRTETFVQEIILFLFCCPFFLTLFSLEFKHTHTHIFTTLSPGLHDWSPERHLSLADIVLCCYSAPVSLHMTRYSGPNEIVLYPLWFILRSSANAVRMLVCRRAICFSGNVGAVGGLAEQEKTDTSPCKCVNL